MQGTGAVLIIFFLLNIYVRFIQNAGTGADVDVIESVQHDDDETSFLAMSSSLKGDR